MYLIPRPRRKKRGKGLCQSQKIRACLAPILNRNALVNNARIAGVLIVLKQCARIVNIAKIIVRVLIVLARDAVHGLNLLAGDASDASIAADG